MWRLTSISSARSKTKEFLANNEYACDGTGHSLLRLIPHDGLGTNRRDAGLRRRDRTPRIFNVMVHQNFTPKGARGPDYPGAIIANHSYQVITEWAYGVAPWFEQGLYMPVTSPHSEKMARRSSATCSMVAQSVLADTHSFRFELLILCSGRMACGG